MYDRRVGQEFRKLSSLSQTGRSTAATIAVNAGVSGMLAQGVAPADAKVLSFTDNRQDASLQAGHLNDFVQTAQIRAGLVAALARRPELRFEEIGDAIFAALGLEPPDFLATPVNHGPGLRRGQEAIIRVLQYRALEDLTRAGASYSPTWNKPACWPYATTACPNWRPTTGSGPTCRASPKPPPMYAAGY